MPLTTIWLIHKLNVSKSVSFKRQSKAKTSMIPISKKSSNQRPQLLSTNILGKATRAAPRFKVRWFMAHNQKIYFNKKRNQCRWHRTSKFRTNTRTMLWLVNLILMSHMNSKFELRWQLTMGLNWMRENINKCTPTLISRQSLIQSGLLAFSYS